MKKNSIWKSCHQHSKKDLFQSTLRSNAPTITTPLPYLLLKCQSQLGNQRLSMKVYS